jgi:mono/diheme cytochrome c family protein
MDRMKRKAVARRPSRWLAYPIGIALIAVMVALGWWQLRLSAGSPMASTDPALLAQGRAVYEAHCARCHGAQLEGQANWRVRLPNGRLPAPPHDASGHTWHHASRQLFEIVKHGLQRSAPPGYQSDMPAYEGILTDAEIWSVLAYIRSTWPDEIRRKHESVEQARRSP